MLRGTAARYAAAGAFSRTSQLLSAGMKEYHEWQLHEPLLVNYEGWRILDNPKMTRFEAFFTDQGGFVRHLDPIIDDPRLTHQQRVCRLYRWALKEMTCYLTKRHAGKFNLGYKVIRGRFEKYRYVTDPGMCDMMVRESQKYLRDNCSPHVLRLDHRSPLGIATQTNPMFHPDNAQVYDHWTSPEVMWYDDAKLHRYSNHHPMNNQTYECHERYGEASEHRAFWKLPWMCFMVVSNLYVLAYTTACFHQEGEEDPYFMEFNKHFSMNLRQAIEAEERQQRSKYSGAQFIDYDWGQVLGRVNQKLGEFTYAGRFILPDTITRHPSWGQYDLGSPLADRDAHDAHLRSLKKA